MSLNPTSSPAPANDPQKTDKAGTNMSPIDLKEIREIAKEIRDKKKPSGWRKRSTSPYFKPWFAEKIKRVVDQMYIDGHDKIYVYTDYPSHTKNTLYLFVNQAFRFLITHMDTPDGKYSKAKDEIGISREPHKGIRLSFHKNIKDGSRSEFDNMPHDVIPKKHEIEWKTKMEEFLEEAPEGANFEQLNLILSTEEVEDLRNSFAGLDNIGASITRTSVKLVKIPQT